MEEVPLSHASHVCRAFLVPKGDIWRLVIDLRPLNKHCRAPPTTFETLKRVRTLGQPNDHLVSFDLADGFYAVGIHPSDRRYLQFQVGDRLFQYTALPMGWNASPGIFCDVMSVWTKFLRAPHRVTRLRRSHPALQELRRLLGERDWARGLRLLPYMDDFLLFSESREAALRRREAVGRLLELLGLRRHPSKGVWEPSHVLEHLGLIVDTKAGKFLVSEARMAKIRRSARELEVLLRARRRRVPARRLAAFTGMAQSVYLAVPAARFFLRALHTDLGTRMGWSGTVTLGHQSRRDLRWWAEFGLHVEQRGRSIWQLPDTAILHCDASDTGWGGVLNHTLPARGFWRPHQREDHITLNELRAVRLTVETFLERLKGKRVLLWEDNRAVMHILTNLTTRSPDIMVELRKLWYLLDTNDITLRARYIRSAANVWADKLSREMDSSDWQLNPCIFQYLDDRWGPHTIDRFATANNALVPRFNSELFDPQSLGVDALSRDDQDWKRELNWCNPPWHLLEDVVLKLRNSGGRATVLAPRWTDKLFYQLLQELASEAIDIPSHRELFFPGRLGSSGGVGRSSWSVTAFRLPGHPPGCTPSYGAARGPLPRRKLNMHEILPAQTSPSALTRFDYRKAERPSIYPGARH